MQIILDDVCFGMYLSVDGRDLYEGYSEEEQSKILDHILLKLKDSINNREIQLSDLVSLFPEPEYKDLGDCEQCGHYSSSRTYII